MEIDELKSRIKLLEKQLDSKFLSSLSKRKIEELSRPGEAKRILNALRGSSLYDGDPKKLAYCKPDDIRKINGLKPKGCYL